MAADRFNRCPGDAICYDDAGAQVACALPVEWREVTLDGRSWRPELAMIKDMESRLVLPERAAGLESYERYFAGDYVGGRKVVIAVLLDRRMAGPPDTTGDRVAPGIHIRNAPDLPAIGDGGCWMVTVLIQADGKGMASVCNHEL